MTESFVLSLKGLNWATARDSKEIMVCVTAGQGTRVNDTERLLAHLRAEEYGGKRFSAQAVILQSGRQLHHLHMWQTWILLCQY